LPQVQLTIRVADGNRVGLDELSVNHPDCMATMICSPGEQRSRWTLRPRHTIPMRYVRRPPNRDKQVGRAIAASQEH
jgi:hypothetical protein